MAVGDRDQANPDVEAGQAGVVEVPVAAQAAPAFRAVEEDLVAHLVDVNMGNAGHRRSSYPALTPAAIRNDQYLAVGQKARTPCGEAATLAAQLTSWPRATLARRR